MKTIRINPESGATQWVADYSYPGDQFFFPWKVMQEPVNNRYLLSTTRRTGGAGVVEQNVALMLSVDAQTGVAAWVNRFEAQPPNRFERMDPIAVVDGRLYASGPSRSIANHVVGLMALDPATGVSEQEVRAMLSSNWRMAGEAGQGPGHAMTFLGDDLLLQWPSRTQIGKSPILTLARRDLGAQKVHADISVTLDWVPISRSPSIGCPPRSPARLLRG